MLIKDYYIVKRPFISLIETIWTIYINIMIRVLKMFINCLRINSIVFKKISTKRE